MRTREENGFRNSKPSKSGGLTLHIKKSTAERLTQYCKNVNTNRTKLAEDCINARLDDLEDEYLESLTREELYALIKQHRTPVGAKA